MNASHAMGGYGGGVGDGIVWAGGRSNSCLYSQFRGLEWKCLVRSK